MQSATRPARTCVLCRSPGTKCSGRSARPRNGRGRRRRLELLRPESAQQAAQALTNGSKALAGGTDLVPLLRDGLVTAEKLVWLEDAVPRGVTSTSTSITVGAGTTLAELETDDRVPQALRAACA